MLIQIKTNFKVIPIKQIDKYRILCEYAENNILYKKGRKAIFYKCDLRQPNIFDFI